MVLKYVRPPLVKLIGHVSARMEYSRVPNNRRGWNNREGWALLKKLDGVEKIV